MRIEIAAKGKETRVNQASMLSTQRSLFGLNECSIETKGKHNDYDLVALTY